MSGGDDVVVGPGRRSLGTVVEEDEDGDEEDGEMIGPPRPPVISQVEEEVEIGPPRPPVGVMESDSDKDDDLDGDQGGVNRYRIPLNNEIVLKGHTKVSISRYVYMCVCVCILVDKSN